MLFLYKCFPYESFELHKVISCASLFTEAALHAGNQLIFLRVPDESAIDHAFDHFTQTACKRYWAVTGWITFVLVSLGDRQNDCLLPGRRKRFT